MTGTSAETQHPSPEFPPSAISAGGRTIEPLDARVTSIQPGGGRCMRAELAWGRVRRWWLKTFRPGYVERMRATRQGMRNGCPHEVLDPRDVKYYRNQGGYFWQPADDPFRWRDHLPFVRVGLAELLLIGGGCLLLAAVLYPWFWPLALVALVCALEVFWFFRNPRREPPSDPGLMVAPADGRVVAIEEVYDEFVKGPAVRVDIFLSVFNVHVNRVPCDVRVIGVSYRPGRFTNALRPSASRENEQLELRLEETAAPHRPLVVRQIAGAIARRIVCWLAPGDTARRGEMLGMIKLGSRTELVLPREPGLEIHARIGQKVRAGVTVLASYPTSG